MTMEKRNRTLSRLDELRAQPCDPIPEWRRPRYVNQRLQESESELPADTLETLERLNFRPLVRQEINVVGEQVRTEIWVDHASELKTEFSLEEGAHYVSAIFMDGTMLVVRPPTSLDTGTEAPKKTILRGSDNLEADIALARGEFVTRIGNGAEAMTLSDLEVYEAYIDYYDRFLTQDPLENMFGTPEAIAAALQNSGDVFDAAGLWKLGARLSLMVGLPILGVMVLLAYFSGWSETAVMIAVGWGVFLSGWLVVSWLFRNSLRSEVFDLTQQAIENQSPEELARMKQEVREQLARESQQ